MAKSDRLTIEQHRELAAHARAIDQHLLEMARLLDGHNLCREQYRLITLGARLRGICLTLESDLIHQHGPRVLMGILPVY